MPATTEGFTSVYRRPPNAFLADSAAFVAELCKVGLTTRRYTYDFKYYLVELTAGASVCEDLLVEGAISLSGPVPRIVLPILGARRDLWQHEILSLHLVSSLLLHVR